jgi:hypothetical protein
MNTPSTYSGFLSLPTELRCQIYDYLLSDPHAITISAGYITCFGNRIQDLARKTDIPGLPLDLAPLARCHHDTSLLSVARPPTVAVDNGCTSGIEGEQLGYHLPAPLALLLTSRFIRDELTDYKRGRERMAEARATESIGATKHVEEDEEGLSLHVSYPYGVLVLKSLYPFLLKHARRVYISGYFTHPQADGPSSRLSPDTGEENRLTPTNSFSASFNTPASGPTLSRRGSNSSWRRPGPYPSVSANVSRPRLRLDPPLARNNSRATTVFPFYPTTTSKPALAALSHLVRTLLPPEPTQLVQLSARILFPGDNSYGIVWGDDDSPASHILRSICGGKINMQVKRGNLGTGLRLTASPKPDARVISTSWENWKAGGSVRNGVRVWGGARPCIADLDDFLTGEGLDKA